MTDDDDKALNMEAVDCGYKVDEDGILYDYTGVRNCTCTYCESSCLPTSISNAIGFFDGFNLPMVAIVYGVLVVFSAGIFFFRKKFSKIDPKVEEEIKKS